MNDAVFVGGMAAFISIGAIVVAALAAGFLLAVLDARMPRQDEH